MSNTVPPSEVQNWIALLRSSVPTERLKGASGLASLAVQTRPRGAIRTRGAISRGAPSRLPPGVSLSVALDAFKDQHIDVRRAVAFAVGEWADETAVEVLSRIAEGDRESSVRGDVIDALGKIGGVRAVEVLKTAARQDPGAEVRIRAMRALADLGRAESCASQDIIDILTNIQVQDPSDRVKDQARDLLAKLG